jgi:hypothetical protein
VPNQTYIYRSPTTPGGAGWSVDLGDQAVRLGSIKGVVQEAELGAAGVSSIAIDDLTGTAGHASDAIIGLKQFDWKDDRAPSGHRTIWTGYIGDRRYRRGTSSESPSLRTGSARVIDITLVDINSFLGFRVFQPETLDATSSFNRPAETDIERVQALLNVDFLSTTLFDGLVTTTPSFDMDAVDYVGQRPVDVLNDCAQQSGRNFFVFYDEAGTYTPSSGEFGLFYDYNDTLVYLTTMQVSNVLADVDDSTTFYPLEDAELVRDPSRVVAGVLIQVGTTGVYEKDLTTSYTYGFRDLVGNSVNLKTTTQADARALRYLAENNTEDDRITFTVKVPAAHVNDWMAGQAGQVKFTHLPGYESYRYVRALTRTVMQSELDDAHYDIRYECGALIGHPQGATAEYNPGDISFATPTLIAPTTPGQLLIAVVSGAGYHYLLDSANAGAPDPFFDNLHGGGAWTKLDMRYAKADAGQGGDDLVGIGIFWRRVAVGEITTQPVAVSLGFANAYNPCSVWLWERPYNGDPTLSSWWSAPNTNAINDGSTADPNPDIVYSYLGNDPRANTSWFCNGNVADGSWWQEDFPTPVSSSGVTLYARTAAGVSFVSPGASSPADDNPTAEVELSDGTTYAVSALAVGANSHIAFGSTRTFTWLRVTFTANGSTGAPGWSDVVIDGVSPPALTTNGGTVQAGNSLAGSVLGAIIISSVDYGNGPHVVPVEGTQVQNADGQNNPDYNRHGWGPGWIYIGQNRTGGKVRASITFDYDHPFPVAGVACVIPGLTEPLPPIPYPANQI